MTAQRANDGNEPLLRSAGTKWSLVENIVLIWCSMSFVIFLVFVYESWYLCADSEAKLRSSESNSQSSYNPCMPPLFD